MDEKNNEIVPTLGTEKIQQILQEVPDDILIDVIANRIQRDPNKEGGKVVQAVSQQTLSQQTFSGPIPPPSMLGASTLNRDKSDQAP